MNLFQNVTILRRELCLCNFLFIYWLSYDPGGGGICQLTVSPPRANANARGLARGDEHRWN